jgi:hypothetical protein
MRVAYNRARIVRCWSGFKSKSSETVGLIHGAFYRRNMVYSSAIKLQCSTIACDLRAESQRRSVLTRGFLWEGVLSLGEIK